VLLLGWRPGRRWDAAVPPQTFLSLGASPIWLRNMSGSRLGRPLPFARNEALGGEPNA